MAVQAQYPSNVLLLNRNGEEEYSLQAQPGGGGGGMFLDQSHMLIHNGGQAIIPRKRAREGGAVGEAIATQLLNPNPNPPTIPYNNNNNQSFSLQSQPPPQLIDISQLHHPTTHPPNISTGLRLSFSDQHFHHHNIALSHYSFLTPDFASQIKRHRDDLDHFLLAQGEEFRRTLAEKRQRHYRALLVAAEESMTRRLREKEAEVEKATRRHAQLEARASQLSLEVQVWQANARAQEAAAASLQAQLQQAIAGSSAAPERKADDFGGGGFEGQVEDAESAYVDPDRVTAMTFGCGGGKVGGPGCKSCGNRVARVVVLPCRHLCLCSECDQVVQACPVCLHVRNSSVEVFLC